jgi:hypothetical protein
MVFIGSIKNIFQFELFIFLLNTQSTGMILVSISIVDFGEYAATSGDFPHHCFTKWCPH